MSKKTRNWKGAIKTGLKNSIIFWISITCNQFPYSFSFLTIFIRQTEINDAFETQEFERLENLKKTITNVFIFEISSLNEFLYDIDLASKVNIF